MNYYLKPLPEDDGVISVTLERIPRWKESELSGDEWRYTMITVVQVKDWENGGITEQRIGGENFAEMSLRAAGLLAEILSYGDQRSVPYMVGDLAEIKVCFQPGCPEPPNNVFRIKQEWTWHPYQGYRMARGETAKPVVRAFCEAHSHRGDCDLEDSDENYELTWRSPKEA